MKRLISIILCLTIVSVHLLIESYIPIRAVLDNQVIVGYEPKDNGTPGDGEDAGGRTIHTDIS